MVIDKRSQPRGGASHSVLLTDPDTRLKIEVHLRGRILWLVWALFGLLVFFDLLYLVNNLAVAFALYHTPCADPVRQGCAQVLQLMEAQFPSLAQYGWSLDGYAIYALVCDLIQIAFYLGMGILIFWRIPDRRMGIFTSSWLITFASVSIETAPLPGLLGFLGLLLQPLAWIGLILLFAIFPDGRFVPRWAWLLLVLFVVMIGLSLTPLSNWSTVPAYGIFAITVGTQVYRYRAAASPLERQQIKWFASGFAAFVLGVGVQGLFPLVLSALGQTDSWYPLAIPACWMCIFVLIPAGIGIALLRYRLWSIDTIINRTLVYGLLTLLLALIYLGLIFGGQALLGGLLKSSEAPVIVVSTLLVTALFQPLRRRIQHVIDRRFYRQKYDATRTLQRLGATFQQEVELKRLCEQILVVVQETVQPVHISLWLNERGREIPPSTPATTEQEDRASTLL